MALFGKRQVKPETGIDHLERELAKVQSALRQLELEQQSMHDQVRRWMRRAVAAERNQEAREGGGHPSEPPPAPATAHRVLTGVRARRLARLMRPDPIAEPDTNGEGEG